MADIGKKVKEAATKAAKDKVSGEKKGEGTGGSKSGIDKAEKALKNRLK
jgi:biotin operon repressor